MKAARVHHPQLTARLSRLVPGNAKGSIRLRYCRCEAERSESGSGSESAESLFARELKRRGIANSNTSTASSPTEARNEASAQTQSSAAAPPAGTSPFAAPTPQQPMTDKQLQAQLERSRKLNSEGLEGLAPRASVLLRLGVTFFLGFGPLILFVSLLFGGLYWVFGDSFVHTGAPAVQPPMYDPYELLAEPTVDPTVPFR